MNQDAAVLSGNYPPGSRQDVRLWEQSVTGRCKDCRWFDDLPQRNFLGHCELAAVRNRESEYSGSLSHAKADTDKPCHLVVHQMFGCVQFEKKGTE